VGCRGVRLAADSTVVAPELFLCIEVIDPPGAGRGEALVRLASAVEPEWLPPERLRTTIEVSFDEERERAVAWKRTRWEDLSIAESEVPPPPGEAEHVLAEAAATRLDRALALDDPETAAFLARVRSLAGWMPELGLPRFGEDELRALLPALAAGRRSFAELRRAPLAEILEGTLSPAQREALRREAPERLEVPSGSRIRLVYEAGKPPVLAVRIQELFGLAETPRVAAGRMPVLLHLLAPSGRPQQVTQDLESFWERTYPQVKKELQGRYPKHDWPADPWSARARRRPGRRRGE
jgi:ATP-dependent helicase HrpB